MYLQVIKFEIIDNYTVRVLFDDDAQQVIDFEPVLHGEMWGPLRNLTLFNQVAIDPIARTLTWPNFADRRISWSKCNEDRVRRTQRPHRGPGPLLRSGILAGPARSGALRRDLGVGPARVQSEGYRCSSTPTSAIC